MLNKTIKACCLFASWCILSACVSNPSISNPPSATSTDNHEQFQNYSLGKDTKTALGQAIIEKGEKFYIDRSSEQLKALSDRAQGGYKITAYEHYLVKAQDNADGGFYVGGADRKDVAVKVDEQGRLLSPHMYYLREGKWQENTIFQVGEVKEQLFDAIATTRELAPQSHRHVLLFQGLESDSVKLEYQEFKGASTEPSNSEVVLFNLSEHDIIRFRSYRFQIISANNEQLKYTVLTD